LPEPRRLVSVRKTPALMSGSQSTPPSSLVLWMGSFWSTCASDPRHANDRNRVRRETGKEQMVRVHYDEGVAIHIGPESCAGGREAVREALTGECAGQPLSHEKVYSRVPTPSDKRKATRRGALSQAPRRPGVVGDPGMCRHSLFGNREVLWLAKAACRVWSASGRRGAEADDARP
jgi:hypothetical protein